MNRQALNANINWLIEQVGGLPFKIGCNILLSGTFVAAWSAAGICEPVTRSLELRVSGGLHVCVNVRRDTLLVNSVFLISAYLGGFSRPPFSTSRLEST